MNVNKTSSDYIIELQDKNAKLRLGLGILLKLCHDTNMQAQSEIWQQKIGFAKQMLDETEAK